MNADSIKIESDERGFLLVMQLDIEIPLVTDEGRLSVRLDDETAATLYQEARKEIAPWLAERESVKRVFEEYAASPDAEDPGYTADDPKHPEFHSVHADIWDAREKGLI